MVGHSKSVETACVSHSGAFTADQVSQKNEDGCMHPSCLVDLLLALCRQTSDADRVRASKFQINNGEGA